MTSNWECPVCGYVKMCKIVHYENNKPVMEKICNIYEANGIQSETDKIEEVYCDECGILFHVKSI